MLTRARCSLAAAWLCLSLAGCAGDPQPYKAHYLYIHRDGYALDENFDAEPTEAFRQHLDRTIFKGIQQRADAMAAQPAGKGGCDGKLRLLFYFHGGLNTKKTTVERMEKLLVANNQLPATCYYPVFVNWRSGLVSSMVDDLFRLRFGHPSWFLGVATSPFVIAGRTVGSLANLPMSWAHNVDNVMESIKGANEQGDPIGCTIGDTVVNLPLQAIYLATIPLLEGFGKPAWEIMKRRAQLTVATRLTDDPESWDVLADKFKVTQAAQDAKARKVAYPDEGAIRTLVWKLRDRIKYHHGAWYWVRPSDGKAAPQNQTNMPAKAVEELPAGAVPVEITLVGHSMGAMILNRLLSIVDIEEVQSAVGQPFPVSQVIYMAPAASVNELEYFLVPYLYSNRSAHFSMFLLNRRDEAREVPAGGTIVIVPRGSLLAWIDTFLEPQSSVGQSTSGRMRNLREYYSLTESPNRRSTTNCFNRSWNAADGPPPEERPLADQYTPLPVKKEGPKLTQDLGTRFRIYESPARVGDKTTPKEHGEFGEPHYLLEVLCHADGKAFRDAATCAQKPYWQDRPPWYWPFGEDDSYLTAPPIFHRVTLQ